MSTRTTRHAGATVRLDGRAVSRIGYGAMQLARLEGDRESAIGLLRRAAELGADHVDTAHFYEDGLVNGFIRDAFGPDDGITVVSKVGAEPDPGAAVPLRPAQRPGQLRAQVEANLSSLGLDRIPVMNLRRFDSGPSMPVDESQRVGLDDQLAAMTAMRDEGKIGAIGLSGVTLEVLRRSLPAGIACVQNSYSVVTRGDEDLLRLCEAEGIAWVPFFPLGGDFPGVPKVADDPAVIAAAKSLGSTPAQVGLAWLLHHSPNTLLITGTADPEHLEANFEVGAIGLDESTMTALDAAYPAR